ncbi:MAG: hypothetical protein KVP17_003193 [Porospora cf. gigantea B]|uniref:uncharacterized protein n=1 Tax=Porospora cf. gigantea B TaxID=2853592 RepID=UPI003571DAD1|nr:MAG: hypothetical protein KVP17_003193 [Porospora cf. gigantea B]
MAPRRHSGDAVTVLHASERKSAIQTLIKANSGKIPDTIILEVDVRPSLSSSRVTADFGQPDQSKPVNVIDACNGAAYTLHYTELDVLKQLRARGRPIKVQSILKDAAGRKYFRLSTNWASDRKTGLFHVTAYGQPRPTGTSVDLDTTSSTKESPRPTKPSQVSSRLTTERSRQTGHSGKPRHSSKPGPNVDPVPYCRSDSTSMSIREVGGVQTPAESTVETDSAIWDDRTVGTIQTMETVDPPCERVKSVVPSQFTFPRESVLSRPDVHDTKELFDERYGGGCLPERRGLSRPSPRVSDVAPPARRPDSVAAPAPATTQPSTFTMGTTSGPGSRMRPSASRGPSRMAPSVPLTSWTEGSTTNRNTVGRRLPVPVSSMPAPHSLSTDSRSTVQWIHQGPQTPAPERTVAAPSNRSVLSTLRPSFATTYAPTSSVTTLTVGPQTPRDVSYATATGSSKYRPTWKRLEPSLTLPTRSLSTTYTATSQSELRSAN